MTPPDHGWSPPEEVTFAELARMPGAPLDSLLLSLAAEFRPVDRDDALDRLDELARPLFGAAELGAEAIAWRVAGALWQDAGLRPSSIGRDALFVDRTLRSRRGHPALLAAIYAEAARRAGISLCLLSSSDAWFVGVEDGAELILVDPAPPPAGTV